jgi:LacI family transcriptional regulator
MRDVAQAAGVSMATVSRVLSGTRPVKPDIAAVVTEAARRLGYETNVVARSLRTQTTGTVGMVVPRISNPYFPAIVEAVERQLHGENRQLLLCDSQGSIEIEASRIGALLARRVDGLLIIACEREGSRPSLQRAGSSVPLVQIDRLCDGCPGDYVGTDDAVGMRMVIQHLRSVGAQTFVFVSAKPLTSSAQARLDAFRLSVPDATSGDVLLGDFSYEWGQHAGTVLVDRTTPDAVVCGDDLIALGLLSTLASAGVRTPEDVLVTGYDDIGFASLANPSLTTVRQPVEAIGIESVRMLHERLLNPRSNEQSRTLKPSLVVRRSTSR